MGSKNYIKHIAFRLKPNQLLKEEIESHTKEVDAGVLLSIVGSLKRVNLRMAGANIKKLKVRSYKGPFEIISGTGTISSNGCHLHISVSDKKGKITGGHLMNGSRVEFTVEVVIGICEGVFYHRVMNRRSGFEELKIG